MGAGVSGARDFLTGSGTSRTRPAGLAHRLRRAAGQGRGARRSALFSAEGKDTVKARFLDPLKFLGAQLEEIDGQSKLRGDSRARSLPDARRHRHPVGVRRRGRLVGERLSGRGGRSWDRTEKVRTLARPGITDGELAASSRTPGSSSKRPEEDADRLGDIQGPIDKRAHLRPYPFPRSPHHGAGGKSCPPRHDHRPHDRVRGGPTGHRQGAGAEFVPSSFQPWLPDGRGLSVAKRRRRHALARASRRIQRPLSQPALGRFGGVYIHSCGDWAHLFPSLENVRGLRGSSSGRARRPTARSWPGSAAGRSWPAASGSIGTPLRGNGRFRQEDRSRRPDAARPLHPRRHHQRARGRDWPETDLDEISASSSRESRLARPAAGRKSGA